jgi:hypothetical protein
MYITVYCLVCQEEEVHIRVKSLSNNGPNASKKTKTKLLKFSSLLAGDSPVKEVFLGLIP